MPVSALQATGADVEGALEHVNVSRLEAVAVARGDLAVPAAAN